MAKVELKKQILLDVLKLFHDEAEQLKRARENCLKVHSSDMRAAGDEVEIAVRHFLARMLPKRFCVTHGHMIDRNGVVSPQLDVIISDNTGIPSLLTTSDGTEYIPIDSVYAIGEVKSTFYKSKKYISGFSEVLKTVRQVMRRPLIENTVYEGLTDSSYVRDIFLDRHYKYLNPLFAFMIFVGKGDVSESVVEKEYNAIPKKFLPGMTVILDEAIVIYGKCENDDLFYEKYPDLVRDGNCDWFMSRLNEHGSLQGNHLGALYYALVDHLNQSYLEPIDIGLYLSKLFSVKAAEARKISGK